LFLKTDGAGNLSFATAGLTGATSTATGTVLTLSDTQNVASVNVILDNQKELRFRETTANGTNYVGLKAPASLSADLTYTLPSADGTSGQVLQTNGSGVLSFSSVSSDYVLLATTDITSSTASISFDGYYSSTYKNYKVIIANLSPVSATTIRFRFRRSNADVTATNYTGHSIRGYWREAASSGVDSTGQVFAGTGAYGILVSNAMSGTNSQAAHSEITIFDPLSTGYKKHIYHSTVVYTDSGYAEVYNGIYFHNENNNAMSGITFYAASGNIVNGNFKLYGIKWKKLLTILKLI